MLWQLCTCPTYRHSASEQKLSMPVHSTLLYDFGPTCHISIIMKFNKHNSFKLVMEHFSISPLGKLQ